GAVIHYRHLETICATGAHFSIRGRHRRDSGCGRDYPDHLLRTPPSEISISFAPISSARVIAQRHNARFLSAGWNRIGGSWNFWTGARPSHYGILALECPPGHASSVSTSGRKA